MVRLPAALAERTKGALIIAADDSAVAATNCRRVSLFRDMACLSLVGQSKCPEIPLVVVFASQPKLREDFVVRDQIRIAGFCREIRCIRF
jgi:hypothetical protein